jgi:hypothetical protein
VTGATITEGRWAYYPIDAPMPAILIVYEGAWERRRAVGTITRYQAMAYRRHWGNGGVYYNVKRHGRWIDIHIVGDVEAAFADAEAT